MGTKEFREVREVIENKLPILRMILVSIQGTIKRAYQDMYALSQRRRLSKRQVRLVDYFFQHA